MSPTDLFRHSIRSKQASVNHASEEEPTAELSGQATGEEPQAKKPRLSDEGIQNNLLSNSPDSIDLSPPPDTTSESEAEHVNEDPEDEIVVRRVHLPNARPKKTGTPALSADQGGNGQAMDLGADANVKNAAKTPPKARANDQRPKRKRASLYDDLTEDTLLVDSTEDFADVSAFSAPISKYTRPLPNATTIKSVTLGIWRESEASDPDKHIVKGFIDSRDRLRTRIQQHNRAGEIVTGRWPLKPGPGGSWTTFHNIIFDDHLVHLDQHQVKEYVKIRAEAMGKDGEDGSAVNHKLAVQQAIKQALNRGPPPDGQLPPLIAYGAEIPEYARISLPRAEKRRRAGLPPTSGNSTLVSQPIQPESTTLEAPLPSLQGHRPTKILLGTWRHSSEMQDEDKHAVFGILGNNDMFRVKVARETRDGRTMNGNFPQGAGALWISPTDWVPETYLEGLTKEQLKEYCRVRQYQLDRGEPDGDREANIQAAIAEAKDRARVLAINKNKNNSSSSNGGGGVAATSATSSGQHATTGVAKNNKDDPASSDITRQASNRRSGPQPPLVPATARVQTPTFRAANRSGGSGLDPRLERANSLASRVVSQMEATQAKVEKRETAAAAAAAAASTRMAPPPPHDAATTTDSMASFRDNINRLNNVWSSQEAHRIRTGGEDAKIHMGVKYERKTNGPFQGKLVSQGSIISIDGEDYVEYRILTKPTFI